MLDEIRQAAARQRTAHAVRRLALDCRRLLSENGELGGMTLAGDLVDRLETLADGQLEGFFDYLAGELSPDPQAVLRCAQAYASEPGAQARGRLAGLGACGANGEHDSIQGRWCGHLP